MAAKMHLAFTPGQPRPLCNAVVWLAGNVTNDTLRVTCIDCVYLRARAASMARHPSNFGK